MAAAALFVVVFSSALAWHGGLPGWEVSIFRWVNDLPDQLRRAFWIVMQLGMIGAIAVVAVVAAIATRNWRPPVLVVGAGLITWLLAKEVKDAVERARPPAYLEDVHVREGTGAGLGFPSGHAALAAVMVTVLWPYCGRSVRVVAVTLAVLVSLARLYFGAHLPLDVIGGAALGVFVGLVIRWLTSMAEGAPTDD